MKNFMRRNVVGLIMAFMLIFTAFNVTDVNASTNDNVNASTNDYESSFLYNSKIKDLIPEEAVNYAQNKMNALAGAIKYSNIDFNVTIKDIDMLTLGQPFLIYSVNSNGSQEAIYYFPVIQDNEVILMMNVFYANQEWSASMGTEYVSDLNNINYLDNMNIVFFRENDNVFVTTDKNETILFNKSEKENSYNNYLVDNNNLDTTDGFYDLSYKDKISCIYSTYSIVENIANTSTDIEETGFSTYNSNQVMLNTNGYLVPQYTDPICWAASVATVVRYETNYYTITARDVCDKINQPYEGAGILEKRSALFAYNLYYSNLMYEQASFGQIQTNILDQKPMLLSTFSSNTGHSVTLMGYSTYGGVNQIVIYNSANQTLLTVEYQNSGTVYSFKDKIWTWKYTLSYH